jgi:AGZA family xanthine/uracil permease-like MFS transporter
MFTLGFLFSRRNGGVKMGKVKAFLNKFFKIEERGSTIANELIGGLIIFLAMFYILPVNSFMVGGSGIEGASVGGVFFATAVSAAIATLIMGLLANFPVALAPGMGVNAFFTYTVCITLGYSYPQALVCVLISGVLFLIISLTNLRNLF